MEKVSQQRKQCFSILTFDRILAILRHITSQPDCFTNLFAVAKHTPLIAIGINHVGKVFKSANCSFSPFESLRVRAFARRF